MEIYNGKPISIRAVEYQTGPRAQSPGKVGFHLCWGDFSVGCFDNRLSMNEARREIQKFNVRVDAGEISLQ